MTFMWLTCNMSIILVICAPLILVNFYDSCYGIKKLSRTHDFPKVQQEGTLQIGAKVKYLQL